MVSSNFAVAGGEESDLAIFRNGADVCGVGGEGDRQLTVGRGRESEGTGCEGLLLWLVEGDDLLDLVDREGIDDLFGRGVNPISRLIGRDLTVTSGVKGDRTTRGDRTNIFSVGGENNIQPAIRRGCK